MLDEVIPQIAVPVAQLPPSRPHRARGAIRRACFGQARRDYIYQHAVQGSQPLLPEFSTYELADHVVQGQVTGWVGKL